MPILGYNGAFTGFLDMKNNTSRGHYDPDQRALMGNPVPAMHVLDAWIYCQGPVAGISTGTVFVGLYEASNASAAAWPLVGWSASRVFNLGDPAAWYSFSWPGAGSPAYFPAGQYMLGYLANGIDDEWTLRSHYTTYAGTDWHWNILATPGALNNPLGVCTATNQIYLVYINYEEDERAPFPRPLGCCCCDPNC